MGLGLFSVASGVGVGVDVGVDTEVRLPGVGACPGIVEMVLGPVSARPGSLLAGEDADAGMPTLGFGFGVAFPPAGIAVVVAPGAWPGEVSVDTGFGSCAGSTCVGVPLVGEPDAGSGCPGAPASGAPGDATAAGPPGGTCRSRSLNGSAMVNIGCYSMLDGLFIQDKSIGALHPGSETGR